MDANPVQHVVDAYAFARHGDSRSGSVRLSALVRASQDLPPQPDGEAGVVRWSAKGERDNVGLFYIRLSVQAKPVLECQRCMQLFSFPIDSEAVLQLVNSPDKLELDSDDEDEVQEDAPEKVLGTQRFNLLEQVEDELVLSLPYVPKHEQCVDVASLAPEPDAAFEESQKRPSPFAGLAQLKSK